MKPREIILCIIFFIQGQTFGQLARDPIIVFFDHTQICNGGGLWTHEDDYFVELFEDSTVRFTIYSSDGRDQYASVLKYTFDGTYRLISDTIKIKYSSKEVEIKFRKGKIFGIPRKKFYAHFEKKIPSDSILTYPEETFILKENNLIHEYYSLKKVSKSKSKELSELFAAWDKPSSRTRKYFTWIEQ